MPILQDQVCDVQNTCLHLYLELKDPTGVYRPQGLLEGLSVTKHPKVFPLEFHFLSVSKVFLWVGPL